MLKGRKLLLLIFIATNLVCASCSNGGQTAVQSTNKLIASIPDRNIRLYEKDPEGVVLYVGDTFQAFDWIYTTPRQILPVMNVQDYDADGKKELSVILNVGSGTGISVYELHVVEIDEKILTDHVFQDYLEQIDKVVGFKTSIHSGKLSGEISIGTTVYPINFKDYKPDEYGQIDGKLIYGNIVNFYEEDRQLKVKFGVGVTYSNIASPEFIGELYADVAYENGNFRISNFRFMQGV